MGTTFVVVGGDAAGLSAAGKAKRDAPDTDVVVFERGDWVSYGACGLPYYVEGRIAALSDLQVLEPRRIIEDRGIDLRRHHEVTAVDPDARTVTVDGDDGEYEESYDVLLLATGGTATVPDVPGADLAGVFSIRSLEAGRALKHYLAPHDAPPPRQTPTDEATALLEHFEDRDPRTVGVVGANKIGIELAEAFLGRGLQVHLFDESARVLPSFGADVAGTVEERLREGGLELHLETAVQGFPGEDGRVAGVETADGVVPVDAVVADVGVEPAVELATDAGIDLGPTGAIATDEYGRTQDSRVYAAGDCAEKRHLLTGDPVHWPFALAANRAGRAVGRTIAGRPTPVGGVVGTLVMKAMGLQVARTGIVDHEEARGAGYDPVSALVTTITRAHYYPGWSRMVVHATADAESGRLLGANMVGEEGAAHRINSVAAAVTAGMTVTDAGMLDFGYAPPFGPVWDPVLGVAKVLDEKLSTGAESG
ncbi:NADPH-dependent 2,4-dienoyl-CoA reductase, sulfur reductase [Halomicrobium zhouii]|uniref:NADPH-dependent 2,4-dienoyl-CoA reductase, sulfur reductase n=1 Tax=Halomicrobium zhouii TaxID=767519 RepID=A0A1I6LIW7_9EURY|nr:FAD-dependent oxidoreductase [Halomicrobium zhouii]SFS03308.1 NADPH-dependent 2,4-dienoyl-CoA reductase, sulfur reductase [Halomicrobium zhouii]